MFDGLQIAFLVIVFETFCFLFAVFFGVRTLRSYFGRNFGSFFWFKVSDFWQKLYSYIHTHIIHILPLFGVESSIFSKSFSVTTTWARKASNQKQDSMCWSAPYGLTIEVYINSVVNYRLHGTCKSIDCTSSRHIRPFWKPARDGGKQEAAIQKLNII